MRKFKDAPIEMNDLMERVYQDCRRGGKGEEECSRAAIDAAKKQFKRTKKGWVKKGAKAETFYDDSRIRPVLDSLSDKLRRKEMPNKFLLQGGRIQALEGSTDQFIKKHPELSFLKDSPNVLPFKATLAFTEEPHTPESSIETDGKPFILKAANLKKRIPTLMMKPIHATEGLGKHNVNNPMTGEPIYNTIGVVVGAKYTETDNSIEIIGVLHDEDHPRTISAIRADIDEMGMSYEADIPTKAIVETKAAIELYDYLFAGVAILRKDAAAFGDTNVRLVAANQDSKMGAGKTTGEEGMKVQQRRYRGKLQAQGLEIPELEGKPSAGDIRREIDVSLPNDLSKPGGQFVQDLYPISYPDGKAIIAEYGDDIELTLYDYTYNDGDPKLSNPTPIERVYREKKAGKSVSNQKKGASIMDKATFDALPLEGKVEALQTALATAESSLETVTAQKETLTTQVGALELEKTGLEAVRVELESLQAKIAGGDSEPDKLKARITVLETSVETLKAEKADIEAQKIQVDTDLAGAKAQAGAQDMWDKVQDRYDPSQKEAVMAAFLKSCKGETQSVEDILAITAQKVTGPAPGIILAQARPEDEEEVIEEKVEAKATKQGVKLDVAADGSPD